MGHDLETHGTQTCDEEPENLHPECPCMTKTLQVSSSVLITAWQWLEIYAQKKKTRKAVGASANTFKPCALSQAPNFKSPLKHYFYAPQRHRGARAA